jgi:hypothetical protein
MAIAFDTAVDGGNNGGAGSLTFSLTMGAGANGLILAACCGDNVGGVDDVTATYNGVSLSLIQKFSGVGADRIEYVFGGLGPASGAHNVIFAQSGSHLIQGGAASYTGVLQSGLPDAVTTHVSTTAATSLATSLSSVADNCWMFLLHGGYDGGSAPTAGTGSTRRTFDAANGGYALFDSNGVIHPAGSYSMTSNYGSGTNPFGLAIAHIMLSIAPFVAAGGVTYPQLERGTRGLNRGICLGAY